MKNALIVFLLGLLGISTACSRMEYGSPYSTFTIKGKVTDADGNPIREIVVSKSQYSGVLTDEQGIYSFDEQDHWNLERLTFTDKDGPANGGEFVEKTVEVTISREDQVEEGDGNWYNGHYVKAVDVVLEKKD